MKELNNILKNKTFIILIFILGIASADVFAQEVPANLQAALFKKIFAFDKTLQSKGVEVAVLGGADNIIAAFKEAGVNAKAVSGNQVPAGFSVVYLGPGASSTKQQSASKGVLSISGAASNAENGSVSIAIGIEGGKPKIIVNMAQLKAEGQELSADLLRIAKVIQ